MPGADSGILPLRIGRFFIYRLPEHVAVPLQPPSVPVDMQGQVALLVILICLRAAHLVDTLADLAQTVIVVLYGIAVAVRCFADQTGRGIFIALHRLLD